MTRQTLAALPSQLGMAAFVTVFFAYIDLHLYYSQVISFPAAYIFLALLAGLGAVPLIRAAVSSRLRGEIVALYVAHGWVLAALVAIMFWAFVFSFLPDAYWGDGPQHVLFPVYDSLVVVFSMLLPVFPHHRRHFGRYLLGAFVVFLASVFLDVAYPGTFSLVPDRAAGFAENPNTAAFVLVLLCCCLVDFRRQRLSSLVILALTSLGVMATLSRGGAILLALLFLFYAYRMVTVNRSHPLRLVRRAAALAGLVTVIFVTGAFLVRQGDMFALSYQPRAGMLDGSAAVVEADEDRVDLLKSYIRALGKSPVIGYGTAYTYSLEAGPHNIYLQQWVDNGLPGLLSYCLLLGACAVVFWKRRFSRGLMFISLVAVYGFFNHNILEERAFLVLLGTLLTVSFYGDDVVAASRQIDSNRRTVPAPFRRPMRVPGIGHVIGQPRNT